MNYRCLNQQTFSFQRFSIVPIRFEDRYNIMNWRNEQIYHLRQSEPLTVSTQDHYFNHTVSDLFDQEKPSQILFSFLENNKCVGYGGLVHINWLDRHAEISFLINSALEDDFFELFWTTFLSLIERVAFEELELYKIFTYAFDLRPKLYKALNLAGFSHEASLKDHCFFEDAFVDVRIDSKFNRLLTLVPATIKDLDTTYAWAIDEAIRQYAISKHEIPLEEHTRWFTQKIQDEDCIYFIAMNAGTRIGSFRLDIDNEGVAMISYLLDSAYHGKGFGKQLLQEGVNKAKTQEQISKLRAQVFEQNKISCLLFEKLDFELENKEGDLLTYIKPIK